MKISPLSTKKFECKGNLEIKCALLDVSELNVGVEWCQLFMKTEQSPYECLLANISKDKSQISLDVIINDGVFEFTNAGRATIFLHGNFSPHDVLLSRPVKPEEPISPVETSSPIIEVRSSNNSFSSKSNAFIDEIKREKSSDDDFHFTRVVREKVPSNKAKRFRSDSESS